MDNKFHKISMIGFISSLLLFCIGCTISLNSCSDDKDSPLPDGNTGMENSSQDSGTTHDPAQSLYYISLPDGTPEQIKDYCGFSLSFNKENHTPNYVSWELRSNEAYGSVSRTDNFWQDTELEGCPDEFGYRYSGYDRGHMCPAADQKWSEQAMNDCFVMANMCPQLNDLNAGAWETLESKERQWAQRDGAIWIIAGPIYNENDTKTIGSFKVRVPGAFFKALLALEVDQPRAIAFVYPNMDSPGNMQDYAMSIDDLEKITGYDFFPSLPDDLENKIEASYSFTEWNRSK